MGRQKRPRASSVALMRLIVLLAVAQWDPIGTAALTCTVLQQQPTAFLRPNGSPWSTWPRAGSVDLMRPTVLLGAALRDPIGSAALMLSGRGVLLLLMTALMRPRGSPWLTWPREGSVDLIRPHALQVAALRPTGIAALTCTVPQQQLTALLRPK